MTNLRNLNQFKTVTRVSNGRQPRFNASSRFNEARVTHKKNHQSSQQLTKANRSSVSATNEAGQIVDRLLIGVVLFAVAFWLLTSPSVSHAQETPKAPTYAYVALEPDIVTNYAGDNSKKLGYVRVMIEMMVADPSNISSLEHHMPLLRATAIEILGAQPEDKIRSLTGRENIRRMLLQQFKDIMKRETGEDVIENIIFTKYLRQGG